MTVPPHTFKIMHASRVVVYVLQSQEKDLHMEHSFCLQTTIGGIVYYVHCQGNSIGSQSAVEVSIIKKILIVVGSVNF